MRRFEGGYNVGPYISDLKLLAINLVLIIIWGVIVPSLANHTDEIKSMMKFLVIVIFVTVGMTIFMIIRDRGDDWGDDL
jgi:ribose/xylose/arabinose/galactoside ABC-type transport system permease subunit